MRMRDIIITVTMGLITNGIHDFVMNLIKSM